MQLARKSWPPRLIAEQLKRALPGPMGHLGDTSPFGEVSGKLFGPEALQEKDLRGYPVAFESIRK